jgi:hypothetical protein
MTNIVAFKNANLPSVQSLSTALRAMKSQSNQMGSIILKMDKGGHWVFGADQTEIEDGSRWAVNPFSFVHGFICWGDGEVLGEKMVAVTQPLPEVGEAPSQSKRGWEQQVGVSLKCITGEDKGIEVRFSTTSVGGKRAVQELAAALAEQVEKDQNKPVPVIELGKSHYTHKSYGKIYTPEFTVKDWISLEKEPDQSSLDLEPEPEVAEPEAPVRRRRAAGV